MSSKFALNPADVATTDRYDPSNNIYPKTIMDKIRRLHYTFGITTGFILLDPWEMIIMNIIMLLCLSFILLAVIPGFLSVFRAIYYLVL
ncbi:hypothetical protein GGI15_003565 [Coemansia interrupta]|uniref:Uncharacterized protein n=1 Tax=Coemansia interrupta TaxID=1126814 RepID=A0A9W8HBZ1_9FUNG|nr:hypothetical protein GGI15_003565 [Coemansia interrupta]